MKENKFSLLRIISKGSFIELFLLLLNMIYFVLTTKYISVEERGEYSILISLVGFIALLSNLLVGSLDIKNNRIKTTYNHNQTIATYHRTNGRQSYVFHSL